MRTKVIVGILALPLVALALAAFGSALAPEPSNWSASGTSAPAPPKSLSAARIFMLLPDGTVEITDWWSRRVFRWDGQRWVEVEVTRLKTPQVDSR